MSAILTLALIAAIILGGGYILNGCTNTVADSMERIASVNSPQAQADGNTARLLGEVQAQSEAIRVEVLTRGQAELQLKREKALQDMTLQQQRNEQAAKHMARMADIEAQRTEATARASVSWVGPVAEKAVAVLGVLGLIAGGVIIALSGKRIAFAYAVKIERRADVPLTFDYNPNTLTAPVILALVEGKPTMINPNTGEVLLLTQPRNAEAARLRYMLAQNAIALQTHGDGKRDNIILPAFDESGD
jgi:hypothetical protein